MFNVSIKNVVAKLTPNLRNNLEGAAGLAMSMGHYNVEVEHWLAKVLEQPQSDLLKILQQYDIDVDRVIASLATTTEKLRSGSSRPPALSPNVVNLASQAWMLASVEYAQNFVSSGHLLVACFLDDSIRGQIILSIPELSVIKPDSVKEFAPKVIGTTSESALLQSAGEGGSSAGTGAGAATGGPSSSPSLDKFTVNLTAKALEGEMDPVLGRDDEVRQLIDILLRRRQNNPILTGEPGVGKTAVVEGFAQRIAEGDVPDALKGIQVLSLDMGLLQAGASVKGEFENRLKSVIKEVKESPVPIIVFIDEAHTLIGAGGAEGKGDAANLLKPALARGEFRTIAATTHAEYKKYFEKDPALTRRFQVVNIGEPSIPVATNMMRGIAKSLEKHHNVRILDEAIEASVKLSARYIPSRQLPDKSVSLLDTACARVALSQGATPASVERARRVISQCETNIDLLQGEQEAVGGCEEKLAAYATEIDEAKTLLAGLEKQWDAEKEIIGKIKTARENKDAIANIQTLIAELSELQGESPMIYIDVDMQAVAEVVGNWTGIPVGRMVGDEINNILHLNKRLSERVVGQDHAMEAIAESIRTSRTGLTDPRKPVGVFLMIGTSGSGKTETALALADYLYGGEQNVVTINMSEFKEEHKVSMLLGASAGYVGYGEGGVLTEAVRRNPYSVVLLDEMEKAHPGIQDVFYNLFDKGTIKDGEGRDIDFKNTIIIMTSNACSGQIAEICEEGDLPDSQVLLARIRPELLEHFRPAFLGRTTIVPYYPLRKDVLTKIVGINLRRIEKRVAEHYGATFSYDEGLVNHLADRCNDPDTGARNVENILSRSILPGLAAECLQKMAEGIDIKSIHISLGEDGESYAYTIA
jgi:type VI secretion system protein VasG